MRLGRDLLAHRLAHFVASFQHIGERHIAQAAHGGVADVGGQRALRVGVLEEVGNRVADIHFIPDADAHRRAFFGVDGLAAQILLVEAHIEHVAAAQPVDDQARAGPVWPTENAGPARRRIAITLPNST